MLYFKKDLKSLYKNLSLFTLIVILKDILVVFLVDILINILMDILLIILID